MQRQWYSIYVLFNFSISEARNSEFHLMTYIHTLISIRSACPNPREGICNLEWRQSTSTTDV